MFGRRRSTDPAEPAQAMAIEALAVGPGAPAPTKALAELRTLCMARLDPAEHVVHQLVGQRLLLAEIQLDAPFVGDVGDQAFHFGGEPAGRGGGDGGGIEPGHAQGAQFGQRLGWCRRARPDGECLDRHCLRRLRRIGGAAAPERRRLGARRHWRRRRSRCQSRPSAVRFQRQRGAVEQAHRAAWRASSAIAARKPL